jgi:hypothetical protein
VTAVTIDQQIESAERRIAKLWDGSERRDMKLLYLCKKLLEINKALNDEVKKLKKARIEK